MYENTSSSLCCTHELVNARMRTLLLPFFFSIHFEQRHFISLLIRAIYLFMYLYDGWIRNSIIS